MMMWREFLSIMIDNNSRKYVKTIKSDYYYKREVLRKTATGKISLRRYIEANLTIWSIL